MNIKVLQQAMHDLSMLRSVFHSEADFQHELAVQLHRMGFSCRLEKPLNIEINGAPVRAKVDLLVQREGEALSVAIELKYVTVALQIAQSGECFNLAQNWGTNLSRFDCLADLRRVSAIVSAGHATKGFSIFLTNAASAWQQNVLSTEIMARNFSIHEGRSLSQGEFYDWYPPSPPQNSVSTKRLFPYAPVCVPRTQVCEWRNFGVVGAGKTGAFRYLALEA